MSSGEVVVLRAGSRVRPKVVPVAALPLLERLRTPGTLADAVADVGRTTGTDPSALLDDAFEPARRAGPRRPARRRGQRGGARERAAAPGRRAVRPRRACSTRCAACTTARCGGPGTSRPAPTRAVTARSR
ncbi:hypothetical protein GCM10025868_00340 [Angustibacter aerolatus]|uniref:Uncharacterized protein n=1 Tax=Angustibacter aerolatus TaxID=1162965 RepID=A0ABQ6JC55_9ACTN|nr:hypothetical protein GCM10025868_00340 [Angustibacter aerolatus]